MFDERAHGGKIRNQTRENGKRNNKQLVRKIMETESAEGNHGTSINRAEESPNVFDVMMSRGSFLRTLREIEMSDNASRKEERREFVHGNCTDHSSCDEPDQLQDMIDVLPDGTTILIYDSFLAHQRYYDDFKHCNVSLIDYGSLGLSLDHEEQNRLIIEQRKSLGKGGLCWDAAFILAEHLLANQSGWKCLSGADRNSPRLTRVLELGAGTGIAGLAVAKFVDSCSVTITDLPELMDLMKSNIDRNFHRSKQYGNDDVTSSQCSNAVESNTSSSNIRSANSTVSAEILRWGEKEHYPAEQNQNIDLIIAADVVATIYSSPLLVQTLHELAGDDTKIFLSYKHREDDLMKNFFHLLGKYFRNIQR